MKITAIQQSRHRLPLDPPFCPSWDSRARTYFEVDLVRVETDQGVTGIGSGDRMAGFAGHEELFVGQDPRDLERHFQIIDNLSFHYGRCWPLDVALWDLFGKLAGQPCWRLLGGASQRVRVYASSGSRFSPQALVDAAGRYLEQGFQALKVRFARPDWREDVAGIAAVRKAFGHRLALMVDANQAWRMPWDARPPWVLKDALAVARALEELEVYWLEEPLHRGDLAGLAALRAATTVRIAGGEMARELHDLTAMVDQDAVDVLQPDAVLVGGLTGLARIGRIAQSRGVLFTPHTWGNGIGLMANAQLVAGLGACPYLEFPYDFAGWSIERRDFALATPLAIEPDGHLTLPDRPGLGLELDEARLAATRIA